MAKCEVVKIKNGKGTCLINRADFDSDKHELADAPEDAKVDAPDAPEATEKEEVAKAVAPKKAAPKKAPAKRRGAAKKA